MKLEVWTWYNTTYIPAELGSIICLMYISPIFGLIAKHEVRVLKEVFYFLVFQYFHIRSMWLNSLVFGKLYVLDTSRIWLIPIWVPQTSHPSFMQSMTISRVNPVFTFDVQKFCAYVSDRIQLFSIYFHNKRGARGSFNTNKIPILWHETNDIFCEQWLFLLLSWKDSWYSFGS